MGNPITGFIYDREDSLGQHSHSLYITTLDGRSYDSAFIHIHPFQGVTSFDAGHRHGYAGRTNPAPSGVPHTHDYYAVTTLDDGHTHYIKGRTGLDIQLPSGGHIHHFEGMTTIDGEPPHTHKYGGKTGL